MPVSIAVGRGVADVNLSMVSFLFLGLLFLKKDISFFRESWVKAALLLWVYLVINSIFRDNNINSLFKAAPLIRFIFFAICFQHLAIAERNFDKKLCAIIAVVVGFLVLDGYIQFFTGKDLFGKPKLFDNMGNYQYYRLTGPFSKRVLGVVITTLSFPVVAFMIYKMKKSLKQSFLYGGLILIIELLIFCTGERSAFIQSILGLFIIFVCISRGKINIPILVSVVGVALVIVYIIVPQDLITRHLDYLRFVKVWSQSSYAILWKASIAMGLENPVFGVGADNFRQMCNHVECSYHPHNIYLEMFSEFGTVGLFLFLGFIYFVFKDVVRLLKQGMRDDINYILLLGASVGVIVKLIPFLPSSGFFKNWYAILLWFMIGWMLRLKRLAKEKV
jgi:O-antigen ligase